VTKVDLPFSSHSSRTGRPQSAQRDDVVESVNNMIMADMRVALKQLLVHLDDGEGSVCKILEQLRPIHT